MSGKFAVQSITAQKIWRRVLKFWLKNSIFAYMKDYWQNKQDINRLFDAPQFRKLKYAALIVIGIVIAVQFAMINWLEHIPYKTMLFLRGCVGAGAIVFVILAAILAYKVYSEYFRDRFNKE